MKQTRQQVRAILLGMIGFIIALLFVRIIIDLAANGEKNAFFSFINTLTNPFIDPFVGFINVSSDSNINFDAIGALIIIVILGLIITEIITSFLYEDVGDIIMNLVDIFFKILEFLIFTRIIIDFFALGDSAPFVKTIKSLTNWTQDLVINQSLFDEKLNISAVIILILIIILDIATESLLESIFRGFRENKKKRYQQAINIRQSAPPNITVNVPQQQPVQVRPVYVVQQPVYVKPPKR
jgi:uncharacterized protein YggT (Ycf19 family)